ncbi:MAG: hypothetical protein WC244_04460 [Patescibacteria group bacterium]|jgi:hypothetical protein
MQEKIRFLINNWPYFILAILSIILPQVWLVGDFLIITEEKMLMNFQVLIPTALYSWFSSGYGSPAAIWNHALIIPNVLFYYVLDHLGFSNYSIQKVYASLILLLIFFSSAYALNIFTKKKAIILTGVLFYAFNFYTTSVMFYDARMFQMILMPLFFGYLFKYLKTGQYRYAIYNFITLFLLQGIFCNFPQVVATFIIYLLAIIYFILISGVKMPAFIRQYYLKLVLFFGLLSPILIYHALISYFSFVASGGGFEAVKAVASFKAIGGRLSLLFQFRGSWWEYLGWQGITYNHWQGFYDSSIIIISLFIIISPIFIYLFYKSKAKEALLFYVTFIIFMALASGSSFYPPIYQWLYENIPFFAVFREPWAKFTPLLLFNFVILLVFALEKINKKKVILVILACVIIQAYPFFSFNFFDRTNLGWKRMFIQPPQYWYQYRTWTKNNEDKTILSYPVYQDNIDYLHYDWYPDALGNANRDASLYNFFSYARNVNLDLADMTGKYKNITKIFKENYDNSFIKLGTVDYILYQNDLDSSQMRELDQKQSGLRGYFQNEPVIDFGQKLFLYQIKPQYYLPPVYSANNIIITDSLKDIATIVANPDYDLRSAIYTDQISDFTKSIEFRNQYDLSKDRGYLENSIIVSNQGNYGLCRKVTLDSFKIKTPVIEYKEINSTKYRVMVHGATGVFPLILAQSFHRDWKIYQIRNNSKILTDKLLSDVDNYNILDSERNNVASKAELAEFIRNGWISTLGDLKYKIFNYLEWNDRKEKIAYSEKYRISSISKNFQGTIKNNNLSNGHFYETWLKKPINSAEHSMVNGYANNWMIDVDKTCSQSNNCRKNLDGTYDFEVVLEYWPQRFFYMVFFISIVTLAVCLVCLSFILFPIKRQK